MSTGSVYLLHFEPGLPVTGNRVARHYLGFAEHDVDARVAQHLRQQGSPLVAAVLAAGGRVTLERIWAGVDRSFERRLKRRHETPRLCPRCTREGRTGGGGPLSPELADPAICRPRWRYRGGRLHGDALAPPDHHPTLTTV